MIFSIFFILLVIVSLSEEKPTDFEEKHGGMVFEGDMILPKHVIETALSEGDVMPTLTEDERQTGEPLSSKLTAKFQYRWNDKIVPYRISKDQECSSWFWKCFFDGAEDVIEQAIAEWEKHTCIKFVKHTNQRDYIEFIDDGAGKCYSNVGRVGGRQVVALGRFCRTKGIAIHEIGHALGFYHEQSRPDRDDYVEIIKDNIKDGAEINFRKYHYSQVNDLGMTYDYDSIMHYDPHAFANWPWQTTIRPKRSGVEIGQRKRLSSGDIEEMRKFYQCPT